MTDTPWNSEGITDEELIDLRATILEYEHALEHIASGDVHGPEQPVCLDCQRLAQSALDRRNKEDFREIASMSLDEDEDDKVERYRQALEDILEMAANPDFDPLTAIERLTREALKDE